jgi:hypothetical protein
VASVRVWTYKVASVVAFPTLLVSQAWFEVYSYHPVSFNLSTFIQPSVPTGPRPSTSPPETIQSEIVLRRSLYTTSLTISYNMASHLEFRSS